MGNKERYRREGDALAGDDAIVRGGELDASVLRVDAQRNYEIYGYYGVSVFALRDATLDELAQKPPLVRFPLLTLVTVDELRAARLTLEPTGRNPRHFDVVLDDLEVDVESFAKCAHRVMLNPYHEF